MFFVFASELFYQISNKNRIGFFFFPLLYRSLCFPACAGGGRIKTCAVIGFFPHRAKYKSTYFFVEYAELRVLPFDAVVENKQYARSREILTF